MAQYGLVCLFLGSLALGQVVNTGPGTSRALPQSGTAAATSTSKVSRDSAVSGALQNKPLITIEGLCENSATKAANSVCKTVITRAEFENVVNALQPGMSNHGRREFAETYADALIMARKAEQLGLDKGPTYEEQMQLARLQVLSQALKKVVLEKASQISESDIEQYYRDNLERFEKAEVERIYVPKNSTSLSSVAQDMSQSYKENQPDVAQEIRQEADDLHARAVAGDNFSALQVDAYKKAGIKGTAPATTMWIRRISLPPGQSSVMDLKPGELSPVLADSNGYYIYRLKGKDTVSLEQARAEVIETLRSQRIQSAMQNVLSTATTIVDASYFSR